MFALVVMAAFLAGIALTLTSSFANTLLRWGEPPALARWLGRFKIWHLCVAVLLCALLFAAMSEPREPGPAFFAALVVAFLFLRSWRQEFVFLMGLRDDELPGRHDKLVWAAVMLVFAPVGLWFFRAYRLAHWPESESEPVRAKSAPEVL